MFYSIFLCNSSSKGIVWDVRGGERDELPSTQKVHETRLELKKWWYALPLYKIIVVCFAALKKIIMVCCAAPPPPSKRGEGVRGREEDSAF